MASGARQQFRLAPDAGNLTNPPVSLNASHWAYFVRPAEREVTP
jgi:hypothetical protein